MVIGAEVHNSAFDMSAWMLSAVWMEYAMEIYSAYDLEIQTIDYLRKYYATGLVL